MPAQTISLIDVVLFCIGAVSVLGQTVLYQNDVLITDPRQFLRSERMFDVIISGCVDALLFFSAGRGVSGTGGYSIGE